MKSGDPGTLTDSHLDYCTRDSFCVATSQGLAVGEAGGDLYNCTSQTASTDSFYDYHVNWGSGACLKDGESAKTVNCTQEYKCKTTVLGTFTRTKTLTNSTYDPDGGGPAAAYRVTEIVIN